MTPKQLPDFTNINTAWFILRLKKKKKKKYCSFGVQIKMEASDFMWQPYSQIYYLQPRTHHYPQFKI